MSKIAKSILFICLFDMIILFSLLTSPLAFGKISVSTDIAETEILPKAKGL